MRYVILRDPQRAHTTDRFSDDVRDLGSLQPPSAYPSDPRIEVESTDAKGRNELLRDPEVVAVTASMPIHLIRPMATFDSETADDSWGIAAIGADKSRHTGAGVTVAVLDTGIEATHPAFAGVRLVERDFSGSGNGDLNGHGTHCTGTIFGRDVNSIRIGVARGVDHALIGKILADDGTGHSEMAFQGLQWAVNGGAHVISMSIGFDFPGMVRDRVSQGWPADLATSVALEAYRGNLRMFDALMALIKARQAFSSGCVVVAAAGNESRRDINPNYEIAASLPAGADGVLSAGALGKSADGLAIAPFSNSLPVLCAPGVEIVSASIGGGLTSMSGTSMACPHVAGASALWWEEIRELLLPATAETVAGRMLAGCTLDGFAPHINSNNRGTGIVTVP